MTEKFVKTVIHMGQKPTPEQVKEIEKASAMKRTADEDAPDLTLEQYAEMAELAKARRHRGL